MNTQFSRRRPSGFTLIELLTVIAIIGVLAGIIIAGFGTIRRNAQKTESLSKLREIGKASLLYAGEHRGSLPVWLNYTTNKHWWRYLQAYIGEDPQSFHSPAHEGFDASSDDNLIATISYGWNYAVGGRHLGDNSKTGDHSLTMHEFPNPVKTLLVADARDYSYGYISADTEPVSNRYGNDVPSVFLDGHVSAVAREEFLQESPWFTPLKPLPPPKPANQ